MLEPGKNRKRENIRKGTAYTLLVPSPRTTSRQSCIPIILSRNLAIFIKGYNPENTHHFVKSIAE